MSGKLKGIIIALALPVTGYVLMKGVSPKPDEIRQKLNYSERVVVAETRRKNQELMKALQKEAGISDEELKKKR